ncbi:hypothetical protein J6O48_01145 [bacterium]|nr:hypothetical protein [bacterium]
MALGFTSHYTKSEQPFGTLLLSNTESETAGSVAYNDNSFSTGLLYNSNVFDSCEFSVSVNIDYSQYANYGSSSGSTETAGSMAFSGGAVSTASTVSSFSGGGCSVSSASFTC